MRNHRKVKALRNKFGPVLGYAFWAMFLEYLTELDGNEFEFTKIECEMFAAELGVSAAEIQSLINFCIDIELLFKDESNFIYSDSLNDALKPVYEKRNRERGKSKARERHENGSFCGKENKSHGVSAAEIPQEPPLQQAEIPQSKVEYSKEEENNISIPYQKIIESYNQKCTSLSKIEKLTESRKKKIKVRFNELGSLEAFEKLFIKTQSVPFLCGENEKNWRADFDWLIENDTNYVKVLEGKYNNLKNSKNGANRQHTEIDFEGNKGGTFFPETEFHRESI